MKGTNEVFTDYEKYLKRYASSGIDPTNVYMLTLVQV